MVEYVDSPEELVANLEAVRDDLCEDAQSMRHSELQAIAEWTWQCRLENRIFMGRDSAFSLHRLALDALRGCKNHTDAIAFYLMLLDNHGHTPGYCQIWCLRLVGHAAIWSGFVASIPSLQPQQGSSYPASDPTPHA